MSFKDISYLQLWQALWLSGTICAILCGVHHEEQLCEIILIQMLFKDISYLELLRPLCLAEGNHLCNFGRRHQKNKFCETSLNLAQWFRRKSSLKIFLILSSGSPFVRQSKTICAILVEDIMREKIL